MHPLDAPGQTDGIHLVDGLEDRQQIEIKAAQIEHGAPPILDDNFHSGPEVGDPHH
jgi:hypothetical protein